MKYKLPPGFTYTAHAGCSGTRDNSLETIAVGVKYGTAVIECDLSFFEGVPVLSHDEPVGGEVTLAEAFSELSKYDGLLMNVDVKNTEGLDKVRALAQKTDVIDRIFYTGIYEKDVDDVTKLSPSVPYYLNMDILPENEQTDEYLHGIVKVVKECRAEGINLDKANMTRKLAEVFHNEGLKVSVWTVDDADEMKKILSFSPDNITTRNPETMQAILKEDV